MKRTNRRIRNRRHYYSRWVVHYTKKHKGILLLGALFLFGVALGTLALRNADADMVKFMFTMMDRFLLDRQEQTLMENFISATASALFFLAVLFVCGFCAIAQPAIVFLPLFRGLGVGICIASLYAVHGVQAISYVVVLWLPGIVLTTVAMLFCCQESLRMSSSLLLYAGHFQHDNADYPIRLYLARYVVCGGFCCVVSLLESILHFGLGGCFVMVS